MENNFQIDSASVSDRGLSEKRPQNEDSFLEMSECGLFAVADGVGGAQAGDVASQMAMEILGEAFINLRENSDAEEMMKVAIQRANAAIYQMSHDLAQLSTMATTIVALHIAGNIATIGHTGDSRLYRLDEKGNFHRETQDHSMVEEEVRAGRMTSAQAATHPSRNVISRALGADSSVEVDMKTIMFEPRTTFLLCSDGITRHIDDFELRDLLLSKASPAEIVRKMKEVCYERGAEDNLTAVIARVTDKVMSGFASQTNKTSAEYEEATVATARPAAINNDAVYAAQSLGDEEEIPTQNLQMPVVNKFQPEEISYPQEVPTSEIRNNQNSMSFQAENAETPPVQKREVTRGGKRSGGFFGKVLTPLLMLLLGAISGAGIYHLWAQNNLKPETPQLLPVQVSNIPLTSFEEARRKVDQNPQQYIAANTISPESAEDFYLLGRAFLLNGKFNEAKQMFLQAKDRLSQTGEVNSQVLANDIVMSLAVINDEFAKREIQKELNLDNSEADMQTNANTNTNSFNGTQNSNGR
jgi:protein phosphatase